MGDLLQIIRSLREELLTLDFMQGKRLQEIWEILNPLSEEANNFEKMWIGGWGREDFDHYISPRNTGQAIQVDAEFFRDLLSKRKQLDFKQIEVEISNGLQVYKKYQQHFITELSVLRDSEKFTNESTLLNKLEEYRWGVETKDYIRLHTPSHIPVYDMQVMSKGLKAPPHIIIAGDIVSMLTKAYSHKDFSSLATRTLRQVELKISINGQKNTNESVAKTLIDIFDNFHIFANQLRYRYNNRSTVQIIDEYDVQDLLHAILKLHFKDVRPEEHLPSFGGSSARMDFLLKNEQIVIEVKKTRASLTDKEISNQLILDVARYKNHPDCKILKCFVYDPENWIKNPRGVENDLAKLSDDNLTVELYIRPG